MFKRFMSTHEKGKNKKAEASANGNGAVTKPSVNRSVTSNVNSGDVNGHKLTNLDSLKESVPAGESTNTSDVAGQLSADNEQQQQQQQHQQNDDDADMPVTSDLNFPFGDGSDKIFGMENFGNTCYFNSILQVLFYTDSFRRAIISFPDRGSSYPRKRRGNVTGSKPHSFAQTSQNSQNQNTSHSNNTGINSTSETTTSTTATISNNNSNNNNNNNNNTNNAGSHGTNDGNSNKKKASIFNMNKNHQDSGSGAPTSSGNGNILSNVTTASSSDGLLNTSNNSTNNKNNGNITDSNNGGNNIINNNTNNNNNSNENNTIGNATNNNHNSNGTNGTVPFVQINVHQLLTKYPLLKDLDLDYNQNQQHNLSIVGISDANATAEQRKRAALLKGPIINLDISYNETYKMEKSLFTALKDCFECMTENRSKTGIVSPQKFIEILKEENELFRSSMHQDAHEFLNFLINTVLEVVDQYDDNAVKGIVESRKPSNVSELDEERSHIHEIFEGLLTSETTCLSCETTSARDEKFLDLSIDLLPNSSVTNCLKQFSQSEMLQEQNKFYCDSCHSLQEAEKTIKLKKLPKILALHLKRFKYMENLNRNIKLFHCVSYPKNLRIFNTTNDTAIPDKLYELYAIVVHIGGGPHHGHYISLIKTSDYGWLLFDDEAVELIDEDFVFRFFGDGPGLATAYVLFYQEIDEATLMSKNLFNGLDKEDIGEEDNGEGTDNNTLDLSFNEHIGKLNEKINGFNNNENNNDKSTSASLHQVREEEEEDHSTNPFSGDSPELNNKQHHTLPTPPPPAFNNSSSVTSMENSTHSLSSGYGPVLGQPPATATLPKSRHSSASSQFSLINANNLIPGNDKLGSKKKSRMSMSFSWKKNKED
ncbi:hypothetical protein PACTADRAFT_49778 [Pachysolen tannophilus NRRL Y-2460]|uniref:Ubiquitin carboxyl-terminal hydrolase n=1 Tax=Pachysolen tannophilus NRRL Y-2460 TaxID=669874 RepID=A0A1E4TXG1_PACTA|nr:hypothetical protein PACTADRAFT_49778 [Pachysolen tannophilus NRRL Y-2460]